jgi:hypothetical protein
LEDEETEDVDDQDTSSGGIEIPSNSVETDPAVLREEIRELEDPSPESSFRGDPDFTEYSCDELRTAREVADRVDGPTERMVDAAGDLGCEIGAETGWECRVFRDGTELASATIETRNSSAALRAARNRARAQADTNYGEEYRLTCNRT